MNDPAVLFYTSDFLTGVMDMSMEERGQYITLLCYQHQKGHIKEETIRLLVGNVSINVLNHFKVDEEGKYYNNRMDIEKEKRHLFTESRRNNGKKGGRPKKIEENHMENLMDSHMDNHMKNENKNININNNSNNNIYNYYENIYGRTLNSIEYETITKWLEDKTEDEIKNAINETAKSNIDNIKYVEKVLYSNKKKNNKVIPEWYDKEITESKEEDDKEFKKFIEEFRKDN